MMLRPLHISYSDEFGGAARAARRLHRGLLECGFESQMLVSRKESDDWRVIGRADKVGKALSRVLPAIDGLPNHLLGPEVGGNLRSPAWIGRYCAKAIDAVDCDVVNLHWVCGGTLSIRTIGQIRRPLVWTLHDMWAFCGSEHYAEDGDEARWRQGYVRNGRWGRRLLPDIEAWTWKRKKRQWTSPVRLVCPSSWLANCVRHSALLRTWPTHVIPNAIDTDLFRPIDRGLARQVLQLPVDAKIVMFGAIGGTSDSRKGWDLLEPALALVARSRPGAIALVVGQGEPKNVPQTGMKMLWAGHLLDEVSMVLHYCAADVVVIPSRQENLCQMATEAHACGKPVVAFEATGICDVVDHAKTGYLARAFSIEDLANGIDWVLSEDSHQSHLSVNARERAVRLWSPAIVARQYTDVYEMALVGR